MLAIYSNIGTGGVHAVSNSNDKVVLSLFNLTSMASHFVPQFLRDHSYQVGAPYLAMLFLYASAYLTKPS